MTVKVRQTLRRCRIIRTAAIGQGIPDRATLYERRAAAIGCSACANRTVRPGPIQPMR